MALDLQKDPHRRFNPLSGDWVLVSPDRTDRPWQGQVEPAPAAEAPAYDPQCYMCPGNRRANGEKNPAYHTTHVFTNDFAALRPGSPDAAAAERGLLVAEGEPGWCRVVCFSPRHDMTLARMSPAEIRRVVDLWAEESAAMAARPDVQYVQVFENRGAMMGASNPHPHGQIWASAHLPNEVAKEDARQRAWLDTRAGAGDLLGDYLALELARRERMVCENAQFVALVPFWAIWPFETMILPRRRVETIESLQKAERNALADILKLLTAKYDGLFRTSFPYSMGFHQSPAKGGPHPAWRLHAHFYPPLLRSATVRKFMVGYELLAGPQRDLTPEVAALRLRESVGSGQ